LVYKPWQNAVASCPRVAGNVERRAIVGQPAPKLFGNDWIFAERDPVLVLGSAGEGGADEVRAG
jgi:hypothetical protein